MAHKVFWIVESGELQQYVRYGECNMCGKCCCGKMIRAEFTSGLVKGESPPGNNAKEIDKDWSDWSEWEDWSTHRQYGLWWWWKFRLDEPREVLCESFVDGKCELWGAEDFPAVCRDWPAHPNDLLEFPECEFRFEKVIDNGPQ